MSGQITWRSWYLPVQVNLQDQRKAEEQKAPFYRVLYETYRFTMSMSTGSCVGASHTNPWRELPVAIFR